MVFAIAVAVMSQTSPYTEPLRPQFHFTAKSGWLNDPNGLVYFKGEYHLFFQHNPFGTQWGNMTWGHAVSKDLVHWRQLGSAIKPDALGTVFSGSAVVDTANTSGLGSSEQPPLVCIYTAAGGTNEASKGKPFTQCLASSVDGRSFTKFAGNPVLPHIEAENRDPKVIWHDQIKQWIMALYLDGNRYALLASPNLKEWRRLSTVEMPGASECPDFFELPVDGNKKHTKWVFWGASGHYRVGSFDGTTFKPETDSIPTNFGNTGYAAQTFFNDPKGRRIQIAWHNRADFPGVGWNQQMGFPTELTLVSTPTGPRLRIVPVREIQSLRGMKLSETSPGEYKVEGGLIDASLQFHVPETGRLTLTVNGHVIGYDASSHELKILDKTARIEPIKGIVQLRMLVDRASIEVYAQGGHVYMPMFVLPTGASQGMRIDATEDWKVDKVAIFPLKGAW